MTKCLYVGNVPRRTPTDHLEEQLRQLFDSEDRDVLDVDVPVDRRSGKPRGFAFVTLESEESAQEALRELAGSTLQGQELELNKAFREERMGAEPAPPPQERPWNTPPAQRRRRRRR